MRELTWCPVCNRKKWSDVIIIETTGKENKITTTCPKCGAVVTKIIAPQLKNKNSEQVSNPKKKV